MITILGLGTIQAQEDSEYQQLVTLFNEWRAFETPPLLGGAPDYTKHRFNKDRGVFKSLQRRLNKINFDKMYFRKDIGQKGLAYLKGLSYE